ncbi:MAG: hypothetical protein M1150_04210 [Patescibacteria group bacterium]|nr:hypothetical protein [Patescibacteria group bacterium]
MDALPPDLKQNLLQSIYLLFSHNHIVIAYSGGAVLAAILSFLKPNRFHLLLLLGFLILAFNFEYDKHIIEPLRNQTLTSIIGNGNHVKAEYYLDLFISEVIPVILYVLGWGLIFLAMIIGGKPKNSDSQPRA